ncbi:uncharacterized protein LOC121872012 [Homarus americanus]|uniref:NADH dehydrogenase [ubiquinone] 1 beta subcomplex subunit 4 n=1 Tax=Homarus americanus TaxID=6706 RepID=A0A8J5MTS9_HOMAM|nr:uncharacterized protein LOC121872012 [Homarus americanus]KAG7164120.1 NADH dehydrogenase [ubiquinone] 1 beta subcomplex subunit 4-like [Homarus americanus]
MAGDGAVDPQVVRERASLRAALKREYQKQIHNPHRHGSAEGGFLFDPAVQRFMSMRATQAEFFKPTSRASLLGLAIFAPIVAYGWWMKTAREDFENKCRTGQVSYASREFKFC